MTREERQLLAAVSQHLRERFGPRLWRFEVDDLTRASFDNEEITVERRDRIGQPWPMWGTRYRFRTVTEGVDIAVALGLLPSTFSSAYNKGYGDAWDACDEEAAAEADQLEAAVALMRIAENPGSPHEPYVECVRCEEYVVSIEGERSMTSIFGAVREHFDMYHADESDVLVGAGVGGAA